MSDTVAASAFWSYKPGVFPTTDGKTYVQVAMHCFRLSLFSAMFRSVILNVCSPVAQANILTSAFLPFSVIVAQLCIVISQMQAKQKDRRC
jgi:hypothetical protein